MYASVIIESMMNALSKNAPGSGECVIDACHCVGSNWETVDHSEFDSISDAVARFKFLMRSITPFTAERYDFMMHPTKDRGILFTYRYYAVYNRGHGNKEYVPGYISLQAYYKEV